MFFYRPRVGVEDVHSLGQVQRMYMVLAPTSRPASPLRLIAIPKKHLPDTGRKERLFAFVDKVEADMEEIMGHLGQKTYETKTRGTRTVAAARVAGEGVYSIVQRHGSTQLAHVLSVPQAPGGVQEALGLGGEGSFVMQVKNPERPNPPNVGLGDKADYSQEQRGEFRGYAWIAAHDPTLLDRERCELLLVGAHGEATDELGEAGEHMAHMAQLEQSQGAEFDIDKFRQGEYSSSAVSEEEGDEKGGKGSDETASGEVTGGASSGLVKKLEAELEGADDVVLGPAVTGEWE